MTEKPEDLDILAAEYVLGTLEDEALVRARRLYVTDRQFESMVDRWTEHLVPLAGAIPPEKPPSYVWRRIAETLPATPASQTRDSPQGEQRRRLHWLWQGWAVGATALAAILAIYVSSAPLGVEGRSSQRYVAILNRGAAEASWIVSVDPDAGTMTIRPLSDVGVAGRALELWLVAADETAPRSLGLLDPAARQSLALPAAVRGKTAEGAALAISVEPPGGSPTGLPTGPILFQGPVLPLESDSST